MICVWDSWCIILRVYWDCMSYLAEDIASLPLVESSEHAVAVYIITVFDRSSMASISKYSLRIITAGILPNVIIDLSTTTMTTV